MSCHLPKPCKPNPAVYYRAELVAIAQACGVQNVAKKNMSMLCEEITQRVGAVPAPLVPKPTVPVPPPPLIRSPPRKVVAPPPPLIRSPPRTVIAPPPPLIRSPPRTVRVPSEEKKQQRFIDIKLLGKQGDMAQTYGAFDVMNNRRVVLKKNITPTSNDEYILMKNVGWLDPNCSPGIVCIRERVHVDGLGDNIVVMENLAPDYVDLTHFLPRHFAGATQLSDEEIYNLAVKLVDITAQMHGRGLVHGDLFPRNIMYNRQNGEVKVIDFGEACFFPSPYFRAQKSEPQGVCDMVDLIKRYYDDYYGIAMTLVGLLNQSYGHYEPNRKYTDHTALNQLIHDLRTDAIAKRTLYG